MGLFDKLRDNPAVQRGLAQAKEKAQDPATQQKVKEFAQRRMQNQQRAGRRPGGSVTPERMSWASEQAALHGGGMNDDAMLWFFLFESQDGPDYGVQGDCDVPDHDFDGDDGSQNDVQMSDQGGSDFGMSGDQGYAPGDTASGGDQYDSAPSYDDSAGYDSGDSGGGYDSGGSDFGGGDSGGGGDF